NLFLIMGPPMAKCVLLPSYRLCRRGPRIPPWPSSRGTFKQMRYFFNRGAFCGWVLLLTIFVSCAFAQGIHTTLRSQKNDYPAYQSYAGVWGDGNYAYLASERRNGVLIYDISN